MILMTMTRVIVHYDHDDDGDAAIFGATVSKVNIWYSVESVISD